MTQGRPVLEIQEGDSLVQIGMAAENLFKGNASPQLVRQLLEARLQSELKTHSSQGLSETEVDRDWELLQKTLVGAPLTARTENGRENRP